jgi:hypothetical protein
MSEPKGMLKRGNIDLANRPTVKNADGSHSSEYSTSFGTDKGEVLVPTIADGKFLTKDGKKPAVGSIEEKAMFKAAEDRFRSTGEHLGIFDSPDNADIYAESVHNRQSGTPNASNKPLYVVPSISSRRAAMPKPDPIQSLMEMLGTPLTRENYMSLATLGTGKELSPEEEAELPARFQKFYPTHEDLERDKQSKTANTVGAKGGKGKKEEPAPAGAPIDWGGMIIPNTHRIKPELDTEHKTQPPKLGYKGYVDMNTGLAPIGGTEMNMGTAARTDALPPEPKYHAVWPSIDDELAPDQPTNLREQ